MNKIALVTGSSGFIGKHLVTHFKRHNVTPIPVEHLQLRGLSSLKSLCHDIKPQYIVHLSAFGNMSNQKNRTEIFEANIMGTWNLLQATADISYEAFVNISSSSVLLEKETFYSATKASAERLCKAFASEYNKPITIIRPFSVYGEYEADFRFIPTVFRSCMKGEPMVLDPNPVHDWIHVNDIVRSVTTAIQNADLLRGVALNAGTGVGHTNQEVVTMIEDITGNRANITEMKQLRSFDNNNWVSDTFNPIYVDLQEGLERYYNWYTGKS